MPNGTSSPPALFAAPFLTEEQRTILRKSVLCAKLSDDQAEYFFTVVERTRLDPFIGQIRPDIRRAKNEEGVKEPQLIIITTLQGLRLIGERTGKHDGESPIEWCDGEGAWREVWLAKEPPTAARASVHRKDRTHAQTCVVRYDAMVQMVWDRNGNGVPNPFWRKMGSHMLGKCSLAACYRGAYPDCSGLYISEELGEELDPDSESAIEAEMVRRAREEKAYWDKEREKGNLPIDEQQRLEKAKAPAKTKETKEVAKTVAQQPELLAAPAAKTEEKPRPAEPVPAPISTPVNAPANGSYQDFEINRIELFKGRTVGSLTPIEMKGLAPWMAKVEQAWANLDEDFKAHYRALKQRADDDYQKELDSLADNLDFGTVLNQ